MRVASSSSSAIRYVAVFLAAGVLYGVSCAPGALWQDSGLIQYRVWHRDIEGFLGLAISHPLYYLVAIGAGQVPLGEFAHRVNCVSALAGAVAVANLYLLVRLWLGRDFPAVVAAATFALSHTFWRHASIAETYTLWTALFLGESIVLLRYVQTRRVRWLYLLGLLNGLALAVHMLAVIPLACYIVLTLVLVVRRQVRIRHVVLMAGLWILGALPFEYLIVQNVLETGGDIAGVLSSAAFGDRWRADVLNTSLSWRIVKENLLLIGLNFPTPNLLLLFVGLYALGKSRAEVAFRIVIAILLILFLAFAFRYTIADRYAFFIPFYALVALLIGLGAGELRSHLPGRAVPVMIAAFVFLSVPIYAAAPGVARRMNVAIGTRGDIPYRDDYEYFLQPWKTGYRGAERFAIKALKSVERDAIICADTTTVGPLLYVQEVQGVRPDVHIATGIVRSRRAPHVTELTIDYLLDESAVYITSARRGYCPAFLLDRYELTPGGVLWRVGRVAVENDS